MLKNGALREKLGPKKEYTSITGYWRKVHSKELHELYSSTDTAICVIKLTFWRRNYFFLILAHPVYKM
jgi:hypothetical protein